ISAPTSGPSACVVRDADRQALVRWVDGFGFGGRDSQGRARLDRPSRHDARAVTPAADEGQQADLRALMRRYRNRPMSLGDA
ncbi:MAG TPA: hypothetical protein VGL82_20780, partial [Bryobacteraceae bacterium]